MAGSLTTKQRALIYTLCERLVADADWREFRAVPTFAKGWVIDFKGRGVQEKIEGVDESDLLVLQDEGYLQLTRTREGYKGLLQPKAIEEYQQALVVTAENLSFDEKQLEKIEKTLDILLQMLEENYASIRVQASAWFWWSLGSAGAGILLLSLGIVLLFLGRTTFAIVHSTAGMVVEFISVFVFRQSKSANQRLDRYHTELRKHYQMQESIRLIRLLSEEHERNGMIKAIINQILISQKG